MAKSAPGPGGNGVILPFQSQRRGEDMATPFFWYSEETKF